MATTRRNSNTINLDRLVRGYVGAWVRGCLDAWVRVKTKKLIIIQLLHLADILEISLRTGE